ncbi:hypothetical protein PI124_g13635 [Phytophthora idaei]|nr:hypothetical protein PI125_g20077 [Phytophthora idaei]KAG3130404.1 hypothetical protein PI126_g20524 [Phytophthora idaei]KAG3241507.1 hypothetical protein PI124_g13635 [Phytophthora idaei]
MTALKYTSACVRLGDDVDDNGRRRPSEEGVRTENGDMFLSEEGV